MDNKICIISLKYLEPYWESTKNNIEKTGLPVIYVDREGIGSMSKAFNSAIPLLKEKFGDNQPDYLFFVTNINFNLETVNSLIDRMDKSGFGGIHPTHNSHHNTHHKDGSNSLKETPFIEWTAPIIRTDLFLNLPLDEDFKYWYFDLVWSYQAKKMGYKIGVDHNTSVGHTYLLDNQNEHTISKLRNQLRWYWDPIEQSELVKKYGANWRNLLWGK
jgi:hypothetical protein